MPSEAAGPGGFMPHDAAKKRIKCQSLLLIEIKYCAAVNSAAETWAGAYSHAEKPAGFAGGRAVNPKSQVYAPPGAQAPTGTAMRSAPQCRSATAIGMEMSFIIAMAPPPRSRA
jgi:hypothetical protein